MKKLLILLLLTGTIWSCNNHKPAGNKNFNNLSEADEHQAGPTTEKLELNKGAKWKVDNTTNNNINNLKFILEKFDNGSDKSLPAYKKTQSDLEKGLNKTISECKMNGADHQALHKWLEPFIVQLTKFKQAATVHLAAETLKVIHVQVNLYGQYFAL
ncbi:MAG: hypothetical protein M3N14_09040 [Bacteroidota bacterium]|nr:hypothetical protein [Bacteroidota bacterium]